MMSITAITSTDPATLNATLVMNPSRCAVPICSAKVTSVLTPTANASQEKRASPETKIVTSTPITAATAHATINRGICHECAVGISGASSGVLTAPSSHIRHRARSSNTGETDAKQSAQYYCLGTNER